MNMKEARKTMEGKVYQVEQPFEIAKQRNSEISAHKSVAKKMLDQIKGLAVGIKKHQKVGLGFLLRARNEFRLSDIESDISSRTQIGRVMAGIKTELVDVEKNVKLMLNQQQAELGNEMNQFNLDDSFLRQIVERAVVIDKIQNELKTDFGQLQVEIKNKQYSAAFSKKIDEYVDAARRLESEVAKVSRVIKIAKLKAHNLRRRATRYQISRYLKNFGRDLDRLKKDIVKATQPLITIAEEYRQISDKRLDNIKHYEQDFKDLELAMQSEVKKQEKDIEIVQKEYEKIMDKIREEIKIFARIKERNY